MPVGGPATALWTRNLHPCFAMEMNDVMGLYSSFALETLLPLCRDRYADRVHGGFHEQLDADFAPVPRLGKRLLVQCRQLYVLSHAAVLGDASGSLAAEAGYDFLCRAYRDDRNGGWFFRATAEGSPEDRGKDLYGHAFVLMALAWIHRAFRAPRALELAAWTLDLLKTRMASPHGGFLEYALEDWRPVTRVRRQNPHMHLVEALLDLCEATGESRWLDEAAPLLTLLRTRFFDPETGTLGEFFTDDWRPDPDRGAIVEPGHHYEWVWLLHRYEALSRSFGGRATGVETGGGPNHDLAMADRLFAFATQHGFDAAGGIHDEVDRTGRPISTTRRIWPVTEAIKAGAARRLHGRRTPGPGVCEPGSADVARLVEHLFEDFVHPAREGVPHRGWNERLTSAGRPATVTLPGTTPYHLFSAAAQVIGLSQTSPVVNRDG